MKQTDVAPGSQEMITDPAGMVNRAVALCQSGGFDEAAAICKNLLAITPDHFVALNLLALTHLQQQKPEEAITILEKARSINAQFPDTYYLQGRALFQLKQYDNAVPYFDRAIALNQKHTEAYFYRGVSLQHLKRPAEALRDYDQTLVLNPDHPEAYQNRGTALFSLKQYDEALATLNKAVALTPGSAHAYHNRAGIFYKTGRYDEALADYDKAIAINPDYAEAQLIKGLIKLTRGEYEEGWKLYEWRWKGVEAGNRSRDFQKPIWLGEEKLSGKTILLHAEQGLGDTIQFCRYAAIIEQSGTTVILEVQESMAALLASLKGSFTIVTRGSPLPEFDFHCPLMSLPLALETTANTIPAPVPYLYANPENLEKWRLRLGTKTRPRIGLVWSGAAGHINDLNRSMAAGMLAPLMECDFEFHVLQKDVREQDAEFVKSNGLISHEVNLHDFLDTASLVAEMDLILSVDTSVAHLAGALGKQVWLMLPFVPDWRWLEERKDSPWYPTARLFRQQKPGEWAEVVEQVKTELTLPRSF